MMRRTMKIAGTGVAVVMMGACTAPSRLPDAHVSDSEVVSLNQVRSLNRIKVLSLNVAHGRSNVVHQLLQSGNTARKNMDAIAALLDRENADVVALQEVDGPSVWSGRFDQVDYLAKKGGYPHTVRGTHLKAPGLDYGTALIAQMPMDEAESVGFARAVTVTQKGFVVSRMHWPGAINLELDLVSVHLDPIRPRIRSKQIAQLVAVLKTRNRPVIVMGDFNSDWYDDNSAVRQLGEALNLEPHGVECSDCYTHVRTRRFVDWILVSREFEFEQFDILNDAISDHNAISATLSRKDTLLRLGDIGSRDDT